jgi:hypothetical protein
MSIEQKKIRRPKEYTLRLAEREDLPTVERYMKDPSRPSTVFNRTRKAFQTAIDNELFWLLTDPYGNINTTAAVHIIPVKADIGSTFSNAEPRHASLDINFAEVGTLWRKGNAPAGFCLELMYSACTLQTYLKANDLSISCLVTQIVADNEHGLDKFRAFGQGWESYLPRLAFTEQFQKTIPDQESRDMKLSMFSASVKTSLPSAARCLLGVKPSKFSLATQSRNVIRAYDFRSKGPVSIDLQSTNLLSTAQEIVRLNKTSPLDKIGRETPWLSAKRLFLEKVPYATVPLHKTRKTRLEQTRAAISC